MRALLIAAVVALGFAPQAPGLAQAPAQAPAPQGPKVQITFEPNGLVTLVANGATLREILAEWSRQGGSTFVDSERLTGAPQTLQYEHQPESVVMSSILRQAAGFMLGPRREGTRGASSFEVVYILPTSNPSAGGYMSQPTMPQPQQQVTTQGNPDDELAPVQRTRRTGTAARAGAAAEQRLSSRRCRALRCRSSRNRRRRPPRRQRRPRRPRRPDPEPAGSN